MARVELPTDAEPTQGGATHCWLAAETDEGGAGGAEVNRTSAEMGGDAEGGTATATTSGGDLNKATESRDCLAEATTRIKIIANLDASYDGSRRDPWDAMDPTVTSDFSDTIYVYDDAGAPYTVDMFFCQEVENEWTYHILFWVGSAFYESGDGRLRFVGGFLDSHNIRTPLRFPPGTSNEGELIQLDLGTSTAMGGDGLDGITQFLAASNVSTHSQDGHAATGPNCNAN